MFVTVFFAFFYLENKREKENATVSASISTPNLLMNIHALDGVVYPYSPPVHCPVMYLTRTNVNYPPNRTEGGALTRYHVNLLAWRPALR